MSNRLSNKKLAIIFIVLSVAVALIYFSEGAGERSFRTELVDIDTSSVSEILINPRGAEEDKIKLTKEGENWKILLPSGEQVNSPKSKIDNLFKTIVNIKPNRLAARGQEKWQEFEVDSAATRVRVFESGKVTLDLMIGRFAFQQPRTMNTYVRLYNDNDVYEVEGFLSAIFNQSVNNYRNTEIIKSDEELWSNLNFSYPADSSYVLTQLNGKWFAADELTDSSAAVNYLRSISRLSNSNFVDKFDKSILNSPEYKLTIQMHDSNKITVTGFVKDSLLLINSSENPESYFDGNKDGLAKKIFIGMKNLVNNHH
ncbi:MAG: hypothetical protein CVV23_11720 [Ignavibacteriae bacterium HGW-Ignavibacteriae-2]|jgi:hypothetical protein|nr:MAG: hypothetical protein CVV23_11720 [Ignavibacteriae bacterium HGW-Ignavibacteriae-2]